MVLVSVLVAAGQGNDGDGVDGLHQSSLRNRLCHHLAAKVWHSIPEGKERKGTVSFKRWHIAKRNAL